MPIMAKLLFKQHVGFRLENDLCTNRGFHVVYHLNGGGLCIQKGFETEDEELEWMCNDKELPWKDHPVDDDDEDVFDLKPAEVWELSADRKLEIEKLCDKLYDSFVDPYRQSEDVKDSLKRMCHVRRFSPAEVQFVDNWIWTNVV